MSPRSRVGARGFFVGCALSVALGAMLGWASSPAPQEPSPAAAAKVEAVKPADAEKPAETPQPSPSTDAKPAKEQTPLTGAELRLLRYQFVRAQMTQQRSEEHRLKSQLAELKVAQDAQRKEWDRRESKARTEYFKTHKGPEKRAYYKELKERRQVMLQVMKDEREKRQNEAKARIQSVRQEQKSKREEFQKYLKRKERPPQELWPS